MINIFWFFFLLFPNLLLSFNISGLLNPNFLITFIVLQGYNLFENGLSVFILLDVEFILFDFWYGNNKSFSENDFNISFLLFLKIEGLLVNNLKALLFLGISFIGSVELIYFLIIEDNGFFIFLSIYIIFKLNMKVIKIKL